MASGHMRGSSHLLAASIFASGSGGPSGLLFPAQIYQKHFKNTVRWEAPLRHDDLQYFNLTQSFPKVGIRQTICFHP